MNYQSVIHNHDRPGMADVFVELEEKKEEHRLEFARTRIALDDLGFQHREFRKHHHQFLKTTKIPPPQDLEPTLIELDVDRPGAALLDYIDRNGLGDVSFLMYRYNGEGTKAQVWIAGDSK